MLFSLGLHSVIRTNMTETRFVDGFVVQADIARVVPDHAKNFKLAFVASFFFG
jgi:hypothetical protein